MPVVLGIDLGTSSVKAMLLDIQQGVLAVQSVAYKVDIPHPGFAEQDPNIWWEATKAVLHGLRETAAGAYQAITAVGLSGQMHGLVLTDRAGEPVRPAIIWLDQRSKAQIKRIEHSISEAEMGLLFRNRVCTGFAFPSLLWVREHEPEVIERSNALLCPKDYLRLKLTGLPGAEAVDASSTCLFSMESRDWAWEIIDRFTLPRRLFPRISESMEISGYITRTCMEETGLHEGIPVVYGSGDQPAQSIGNGIFQEGQLICNIGTGGQISSFIRRPIYDKRLRTNTFCHAIPDGYTIFGATLCAGMSMNWVKNQIFHIENYSQINQEAKTVPAGSDGLIYLPYLSGERTPHMSTSACGMFFGMHLLHERGHFLRAVMEGVSYSLRDCLELLQTLGIDAEAIIASGGAAASPLWLQIQADILQKPVRVCTVKEQACLGACILAAVGAGLLPSIAEGCHRFVTMDDILYTPDPRSLAIYENQYRIYQKLYQQTNHLMC